MRADDFSSCFVIGLVYQGVGPVGYHWNERSFINGRHFLVWYAPFESAEFGILLHEVFNFFGYIVWVAVKFEIPIYHYAKIFK